MSIYFNEILPLTYGGQILPSGYSYPYTFDANDVAREIEETTETAYDDLRNMSSSIWLTNPVPYSRFKTVRIRWSRICSSNADADDRIRLFKAKLAMGGFWLRGTLLSKNKNVQQRVYPTSYSAKLRFGKAHKIIDFEIQGYKLNGWLGQTLNTVNSIFYDGGGYSVANLASSLAAYNIDDISFDHSIHFVMTGNITRIEYYNALPHGTMDYDLATQLPSDLATGYHTAMTYKTMTRWTPSSVNFNGAGIYGLSQTFYLGGVSANYERSINLRYVDIPNGFYPANMLTWISPASKLNMSFLIIPHLANSSVNHKFREVFA